MASLEDIKNILKSDVLSQDFLDIFLGEKISSGSARDVYVCAINESFVIKIESKAQSFQNTMEWNVWQEVQNTSWAEYFAPCLYISACGTILIQRKCEFINKKDYPVKVPAFFTDRKYGNYGLYKGKFVCFDYGTTIVTKGFDHKMIRAKWWGKI